jgi:hypothetical protein
VQQSKSVCKFRFLFAVTSLKSLPFSSLSQVIAFSKLSLLLCFNFPSLAHRKVSELARIRQKNKINVYQSSGTLISLNLSLLFLSTSPQKSALFLKALCTINSGKCACSALRQSTLSRETSLMFAYFDSQSGKLRFR